MSKADFKKYKSIAIMGGAFDPPHFGHFVTAQTVYDSFDVDKVIIMPLGDAPHKENSRTKAEDRYNMVLAGIDDNDAFDISDMEINRKGKTYTVDTIAEIKKINPELKIYFVIGADEAKMLDTWHEPERLLKMCSFIAVSRPGFDRNELIKIVDEVRKKYCCDIHYIDVPALDISSSDLREKISEGRSIKYLVPDKTEKYINEHNLYRRCN